MSFLGNTKNNEVQILEFALDDNRYGIVVSIVSELLQYRAVQPMPRAPVYVEGIISPRNELMPVVDLAAYLKHGKSKQQELDIFIIAEILGKRTAFHVHKVIGMHLIPQDAIKKPDSSVFGDDYGIISGISIIEDKVVSILDFNKIISSIDSYSFEK
ncbi:chemotaxis protein CheV [Oxobacter pfennigii]|uniref:Chemotaxis protein CheV n=1 Tax=Oxobacter pfennigii TaxID=36849 RepID=A0A0N8NT14_9CLOT|nr:chemotaxis protein CheW [Oxobacter pfennigii]KPU43560.1 chemotaxis protein CheV [Oxobacter pfennigii]